jgi:protocadherin-16/23
MSVVNLFCCGSRLVHVCAGQLVQFFVRASVVDSIIPYVDVPVDVYITNDQLHSPPVFLEKSFVVEVPETLIVGSIVAHIQAQHTLPLVSSLVSGFEGRTNNPAFFDINEHDGNILLTRALDREDIAQYRLTLRAEVKDNAYLAVETVIIVKVTDVNDNKPVFIVDQYNIAIPENVAIGTSVVQVVALDKDSGASGRVSYRLAATTITAGVFVIDTNSGWLRVVGSVDRETRTDYSLEVIAWEDETLERHSAKVTMKITLLDQNDVAPQFELTQYLTAVNEDAQVDTAVLLLPVNDLDTPAQSRLTYHITAGDSLVQFGVRSSGELYVLRPLDRELKAEHRLTVLVTDGVATASATVIISILDANDHAPICRQVCALVC